MAIFNPLCPHMWWHLCKKRLLSSVFPLAKLPSPPCWTSYTRVVGGLVADGLVVGRGKSCLTIEEQVDQSRLLQWGG